MRVIACYKQCYTLNNISVDTVKWTLNVKTVILFREI